MLEEEISRLESALEKAKTIKEGFESRYKDYAEIQTIVNGLLKKLGELLAEDKVLSKDNPRSDAEWEAFSARRDRISKIDDALDKLITESDAIWGQIENIVGGIDCIDDGYKD